MAKQEERDCRKIEVWWLLRDIKEKVAFRRKTVMWGKDGDAGSITCNISLSKESYVNFSYTYTGFGDEKIEMDYTSRLIKTPCHFGGYRYWFECPLLKDGIHCKRRVGVLYLSGNYFGCRHCHELTYASRNRYAGYVHYGLFRELRIREELKRIAEKTKRYTYRGRPTKNRRKMEALQKQMATYYKWFKGL